MKLPLESLTMQTSDATAQPAGGYAGRAVTTDTSDPRFNDPSRYPCAVLDCDRRAVGWIGPELVPPALDVFSDGPRVYLCTTHGPEWWTRTRADSSEL